jgi:hypothetical protein
MVQREIERSLSNAETATPFYAKYIVLKDRLLNNEYEHWAAHFPDGNNHGPGHIGRVLDKLGELLGDRVLENKIVTPYELFLSMMAILYHDVGILRERKDHGDISAQFLDLDDNDYIFDHRDKAIIRAAVVSHSSSKDIEQECAEFSDNEYIGGHEVRPRLVAALVRLADELDEDYRRADPKVAAQLGIADASKFYWAFSQRILATRPDRQRQEIYVGVRFEPADVNWTVHIDNKQRPFICAFAEKLAKINRERAYVARFLPRVLRYQRLIVSVKPLPACAGWTTPRDFIFNDATSADEFIRAFPELSVRPFQDMLRTWSEEIRTERLDEAKVTLSRMESIFDDLPTEVRLRTLWSGAIINSIEAGKTLADEAERTRALDAGVNYLKRWHALGRDGAWSELGKTAENQVFQISQDGDLAFLYAQRQKAIEEFLGEHRTFLLHFNRGGGGGCIPSGVAIDVPGGAIPIDEVRVGTTIMSASLVAPHEILETKVLRVFHSREEKCIRLNARFIFTPSQPLYSGKGTWIEAGHVFPGLALQTANGNSLQVATVEHIEGPYDVYTLTTDHPTHNFIVGGLVCKNKKPWWPERLD